MDFEVPKSKEMSSRNDQLASDDRKEKVDNNTCDWNDMPKKIG